MGLAIDVDRVAEVLLPDGEWHKVGDTSFVIDSYEYVQGAETTFKGGQAKEVIPAAGASWTDPNGAVMFCPLTSILAVRYAPGSKENVVKDIRANLAKS